MPRKKCTARAQKLQELLTSLATKANDACQFSQRKRQCDAERFVQTLVLGWLHKPGASLEQLTQVAEELGCRISSQGLDERLTERGVLLLAYVLSESLHTLPPDDRLRPAVLERFTAIQITDSTQFKLPASLYGEFRGNGTTQAMGKWQVGLEYLSGMVSALEWKEGRQPDQNCTLPEQYSRAGSLQLFDLGYFKQDRLAQIDQQGAFFVSRYQSQTALYQPETGAAIALASLLSQTTEDVVEWPCLLGRKQLVTVRLVAQRLSQQAADERRRQARKKARDQKKHCSVAYLTLLGWKLMVTNLPAADYPPELVFALYGLRWQIEILFKTWKSHLKVAHIGNWRAPRVFCQLYASLIACVLCQWWTSPYRWWQAREYSVPRMITSIQNAIPHILRCLARRGRGLSTVLEHIEGDFARHAHKERRKKSPSTLQYFMDWGLT